MVKVANGPDDEFTRYQQQKQQKFEDYKAKKQRDFNAYVESRRLESNGEGHSDSQGSGVGDEVVMNNAQGQIIRSPEGTGGEMTGGILSVYNIQDDTTTQYNEKAGTVTVFDKDNNIIATRPLKDGDIEKAQKNVNGNNEKGVMYEANPPLAPVSTDKVPVKNATKRTYTPEKLNKFVNNLIKSNSFSAPYEKALINDANYRKILSNMINSDAASNNLKIDLDAAKSELSRLKDEYSVAQDNLQKNKDRAKYFELASIADTKRKNILAQQNKISAIEHKIKESDVAYKAYMSSAFDYVKFISEWKDGEVSDLTWNLAHFKSTKITLPDGRKAYKLDNGRCYPPMASNPDFPDMYNEIKIKK